MATHATRMSGGVAALRRAGTAVALMAVVILAAAAPAQAAPGSDTTVVETLFRAGPGGSASVTTSCPAGRRVVGGGVGVASNGAFQIGVHVSGPVDESGNTADTNTGDVGRGWLASVKDDGNDRLYAVFALCSATSDATIAQSNLSLAANAKQGTGASTCPAGTRVVGGGVGSEVASQTVDGRVALSGPLGQGLTVPSTGDVARAWVASVSNTGAAQNYRVFALCSATSDATIAEASFTVGVPAEGEAVARCPAGQRALSGGIVTTASTVSSVVRRNAPQVAAGSATINSAILNGATVDTDVSRRWAAGVVNLDVPRTYKVLALCAADEPPPGTPESPAPSGPGPLSPGTGAPGLGGAPGLSTPLAAIRGLSLSSTRFRAARSGPSVTTRGGLGVSYALSAAASVLFTVERKSSGRKVGGTCVRATRRNRKRPKCVRYVPVAGSFTRTPAGATDEFRFSGRLNGRTLSAGGYHLVAEPAAEGRTGTPASSAFTILKPRR